jgi:hypothetical protein
LDRLRYYRRFWFYNWRRRWFWRNNWGFYDWVCGLYLRRRSERRRRRCRFHRRFFRFYRRKRGFFGVFRLDRRHVLRGSLESQACKEYCGVEVHWYFKICSLFCGVVEGFFTLSWRRMKTLSLLSK